MLRITVTKTVVVRFEDNEKQGALDISRGVAQIMDSEGYAVEHSIGSNLVRVTGRLYQEKP